MSLTQAQIDICNQALDVIGAATFTLTNQSTANEGIKANRHYEQTKKSLLIELEPIFALARDELDIYGIGEPMYWEGDLMTWESEDMYYGVIYYDDDFEWDYIFSLPSDYLRLKSIFEFDGSYNAVSDRFAIEGGYVYTNEDSVSLRYIKDVTDTSDFDSIFTDIFIMSLALKFLNPLAGTANARLREDINLELRRMKMRARAIYKSTNDTSGRSDWNLARFGSGIV